MEEISFGLFDDHQLIAHALKKILASVRPLKFIFKAHSKCVLLEMLEKHTPRVLFVSYPFAHIDSEDVVEKARNQSTNLKIILLPRTIECATVLKFIDQGVNCVLQPSADFHDLKLAVDEVIRKEYCFTELFSQSMLSELRKRKILRDRNNDKPTFSEKKILILNYIYLEHTHKEIGDKMELTHRSIGTYVTDMIHEVGAKNVIGLLKYAMRHNLIREAGIGSH